MTKTNVRLTTINIALMVVLVAILAGMSWQWVGADEGAVAEPEPTGPGFEMVTTRSLHPGMASAVSVSNEMIGCDFDADFVYHDPYTDVAELLGIELEALWEALESGKSLAEIADANGVDPQAVVDTLVAAEAKWIDELVESGELSAEEAAEFKAEMGKYIEFEVFNSYVDPFAVAADAIGIDVKALWDALDDGKSPAEVAEENGVDPQVVIDAVIAAENAQVDKEVAAGLISEEDAAEWRNTIPEYVAEMINMALPPMDMFYEDVEVFPADAEFEDGVFFMTKAFDAKDFEEDKK